MAAETSVDAQVPVTLALAKLGVLFSMEYLKEVSVECVRGDVKCSMV